MLHVRDWYITIHFISFNHSTSIKWFVSWTVGIRLLKPLCCKMLDWLNFRLGKIIGLILALEKRYYQNKTQLHYIFDSVYLQCFRRTILMQMSKEVIFYVRHHEPCICETCLFAPVIYRKFSRGYIFYRFNGENIKVMLEYLIKHTAQLLWLRMVNDLDLESFWWTWQTCKQKAKLFFVINFFVIKSKMGQCTSKPIKSHLSPAKN